MRGTQVLGQGTQVSGQGAQVSGQGAQEPGYSMLPSTVSDMIIKRMFTGVIIKISFYILLLNTSSELMSLISISFMSPSIHPSI